MISAGLTIVAFAFYVAALVCYGTTVFGKPPSSAQAAGAASYAVTARWLLIAGILTQFIAIGAWCITVHRSPFASPYGTLAVSAWMTTIAYAYVERRNRLTAAGMVVLLLACLLLFWGVLHARSPISTSGVISGDLVNLHVMTIVASFALFIVASGCAMLYLIQARQLKVGGHRTLFRRLPPLSALDAIEYHSVALALPLLTIGLGLGFLRTYGGGLGHTPMQFLTDIKTIASFVTWLLYGIYLGAHSLAGWRGVKLQYILIAGLTLALALYVVPTTVHRFG